MVVNCGEGVHHPMTNKVTQLGGRPVLTGTRVLASEPVTHEVCLRIYTVVQYTLF